MEFKFTIEDFLNDFGGGFIFLFGLAATNDREKLSNISFLIRYKESNLLNGIFVLIAIYIIGLALSAITNFLEQDLYLFFEKLIRKTYTKETDKLEENEKRKKKLINALINKPLFILLRCTLYLFFRRWASIETMMRLKRTYEKLEREKQKSPGKYADFCDRHKGLLLFVDKNVEEIFAMEEMLKKGSSTFGMHYWYKSQFWQIGSNAVFFIYILNLFVFKSALFLSINTIIYLAVFFLGKSMSPMYVKMYLRQMSREYNTLEKLKKESNG